MRLVHSSSRSFTQMGSCLLPMLASLGYIRAGEMQSREKNWIMCSSAILILSELKLLLLVGFICYKTTVQVSALQDFVNDVDLTFISLTAKPSS
jgi:hypothetical protein